MLAAVIKLDCLIDEPLDYRVLSVVLFEVITEAVEI